ncbi:MULTISPECIES: alpha/beta hydrolase [unclassified Moritella]|uniref:alpha/beta hydrolase n=1 Tax=unclassified Moritella TaxID=2637987 RepID=UPI001BA594E6|nr:MULTISPECIES: carboxylesterase [unclassified Moritella]QUM86490.1 carboxylesterase [Moritella sp. 28]QUM90715.1 carboxylesterase [Moritella sp. 36]
MTYLPCVEIEPNLSANASVIWLHGLGANGHDFAPVVPMIALPVEHQVRYVFPHAPDIKVTINNGYKMPAWYDILEMTLERKIDMSGLMISVEQVQHLIQREIDRGIDSARIIVAGFSQGGAVAYQSALTFPQPLAGLMVMSSYFATYKTIELHKNNLTLPIHVYHGSADPVVAESLGLDAVKYLEALGYEPRYSRYPAEHTVTPQQINDISQHITQFLSIN